MAVTAHLPRKPSFRWIPGRSCTNIQTGPLNGGRPGSTHFLMKRLKNVRTEMALSVLAYNLTRVMNIIGIRPLIQAMGA